MPCPLKSAVMRLNYLVKCEKVFLFLNGGRRQMLLDGIMDVACVRDALQKASQR